MKFYVRILLKLSISIPPKVAELKQKHSAIREAKQALLPATLERLFGPESCT
jgi:hypothetical protein